MKRYWLDRKRRVTRGPHCRIYTSSHGSSAFTLIEVLVSLVILTVAVAGSISAFNLITQSVRGTGVQADQSRRIDQDIAAISRLSELYTSCVVPRGSNPGNPAADCTGAGVLVGNSFYYFPNPDDANFIANQAAFFDACRTSTPANHITSAFITAVNGLGIPGGNVTRQAAVRVDPNDGANHLVRVTWIDPTRNNRELNSIQIYPLVSSWCP